MSAPHATAAGRAVSLNINILMRLTGTTGEALGEVIGKDKSTVSRKIKSGYWTIDDLDVIAAHWGIPISRLLEDPTTYYGLPNSESRCTALLLSA